MTTSNQTIKYVSTVFCFISLILPTTACGNNQPPRPLEFWEVNSDFQAPVNWKQYDYADAFSIKIPTYMHEKTMQVVIDEEKFKNGDDNCFSAEQNTLAEYPLNPGEVAETSFDADHSDGIHKGYAHIGIMYMKGNTGDFLDYLDNADLTRPDSKEFCDLLIKSQLGSGVLIKVLKKDMVLTNECNMMLDLCYQRAGNTEGEGPVTVHIFYLQHTDEAVRITVSYHDKDKDVYKDLFNIIETLNWTQYKNKKSNL